MSKTALIKAAISVVALGILLWVIPFRDTCAEPDGGRSRLSRTATGCVLHGARGDRTIGAAECAALVCQPGLVTTFSQARLGAVLALGLCPFFSSIVWSMRWRTLLAIGGRPPGLMRVWRITVESQAGGVLLPGGVGGDALRIAWATADGVPLGVAVGSIALDRAIGLTMLALTAATLGLGLGGLSAGPLAWALAGIPLAFLSGVLLLRSPYLSPEGRVGRLLFVGWIGRALRPLMEYVRAPGAPRAIVRALALGAVLSVYQLALIRGLVYALRASPTNEAQVFVGTAMAFVVFALPALPGAWGTGDAAFVFFFAPAGLDASVAVGTSMLYRLFWYSQGLFGALVGLFGSGRPPSAQAATEEGQLSEARTSDPPTGAVVPAPRRRAMTLVVCALNEERWIRDTVESLVSIADDVLDAYDLILVDDGGQDRTGEVMEELARRLPHTRVVHNPEPRGLGWMFWEFIGESEHPYFMMLAGNGESTPESVRRLMEETGSADLIVGYRTSQKRSLVRSAISKGFQRTISLAFGFGGIRDWTGMFVWPVDAVRRIERLPPTNVYSVEVLVRLLGQGVSMKQVPAPQGPDRAKSKVVGWKTARQTLNLLWRTWRARPERR